MYYSEGICKKPRVGAREPTRHLTVALGPTSDARRPGNRRHQELLRAQHTVCGWANGQEAQMRNRDAGSWHVRSLAGLKSALMVSCGLLLLAGSATILGGGELQSARFEFALIGDMPYDARHEQEFAHVMKDINAADVAFVVHVGDFWWDGGSWTEQAGAHPPCGDEAFQDRLGLQ